jgi:ribosomal protein S18 acetylase RimI-like enzyme
MLCDVIELRALAPDDWPVWRELRLAALAEAPYAFGSRLQDWQGDGDVEQRWRARLSIPRSYHVVAVVDGQPVGMASGMPADEEGVVELWSMWVSPGQRGRDVGNHLVRAVERWAGRVRARQLRLAVAQGNDSAIALYRRHGFRDTGRWELMPDGVRREHVMVKPLGRRRRSSGAAPGGRSAR